MRAIQSSTTFDGRTEQRAARSHTERVAKQKILSTPTTTVRSDGWQVQRPSVVRATTAARESAK
ncbi:hypothetical protein EXIGLDRAFT_724513 [Exidia glandulosa HHB12029]|uniref:Uncharacterized protein n=1 Tax=Exidia glandulosa HHB12029 TaxID=1314781 RepID=A0A165EDJ7_EXIGL|nr:hypothetical protein EXIGLDRAFT_724513 [Exidia glandulosa HHB12029]